MESVAVLDLGSYTLKAGVAYRFPSDDEPRVVTPSSVSEAADPQEQANGSGGSSSRPIVERGTITDWDGLEALLHDTLYSELGWLAGEEGSVLMSEPLFQGKADRERLAQLLFEQFNLNGLFLAEQPLLNLYSVGKTTGLVIDLGHGKTDIAAVVEGQVYHPASRRLRYGGQDLTQFLGRLLHARGGPAAADAAALSLPELTRLKEACMRVAQSGEAAAAPEEPAAATEHQLPGGRSVSMAREGWQLGEALLDGRLLGLDEASVAESAAAAAMTHPDPLTRKALFESLLVCGGASGAPGGGVRLLGEVCALAPPSVAPALAPVPEYMPAHTLRAAAWLGGAVLSKIVFTQNHHVSKYDYDEVGPAVVHRKCFA